MLGKSNKEDLKIPERNERNITRWTSEFSKNKNSALILKLLKIKIKKGNGDFENSNIGIPVKNEVNKSINSKK